ETSALGRNPVSGKAKTAVAGSVASISMTTSSIGRIAICAALATFRATNARTHGKARRARLVGIGTRSYAAPKRERTGHEAAEDRRYHHRRCHRARGAVASAAGFLPGL